MVRQKIKIKELIHISAEEIPNYAHLERATELGEMVQDLPPLPRLVVQGMELLEQDDPCPSRLADLFSRDPSLTARLLRTGNSPVFNRGVVVTTPHQAVRVLGLTQVKSILVMACLDTLRQETARDVPPEARNLREQAWQNSLCTAIAASRIAREFNLPCAEEAFVYGLLHDLGKLALIHILPDGYVEAYSARGRFPSLIAAETAILGVAHPLVGAVVAHKWRFPVHTCEVIRLHHETLTSLLRGSASEKATVVRMADLIAHHMGFGHRHGEAGLLDELLSAATSLAPGQAGLDGLVAVIGDDLARRVGVVY